MNQPNGIEQRIRHLEAVGEQAIADSRSVVEHTTRLHAVEEDVSEVKADVKAIRAAQGRNFIVSLIAATGSIGTIFGIVIALSGGGP